MPIGTYSLPGIATGGQPQHLGDNSLIPTSEGQRRRVLLHTDLDTSPSQFLGGSLDFGDILGPTESNVTESSSASIKHKEYQHHEGQPDDSADERCSTDSGRYHRPQSSQYERSGGQSSPADPVEPSVLEEVPPTSRTAPRQLELGRRHVMSMPCRDGRAEPIAFRPPDADRHVGAAQVTSNSCHMPSA